MKIRPWTLVLPYYENPGMLVKQLEWMHRWPTRLQKEVSVILVDDGSPVRPALPVIEAYLAQCKRDGRAADFGLSLYRIGVDVRWNWIACRNLAMAEAKTEWRLMTDIDHLVPAETGEMICTGRHLEARRIYRFNRVDYPDGTPYKPHPNSWLMTGEMFDRTGGYDERFSGFYGTDGMYRDRCLRAAERIDVLPQVLIRVPREAIPDASTTTYGRKEKQDHDGVQRIRAEIAKSGKLTPLRGSFPWERLL